MHIAESPPPRPREPDAFFDPSIIVRRRRFMTALVGTALVLLVASVTGQWLQYVHGVSDDYELIAKFFLGTENNIPTYFSSFLLLTSAALLFVIAAHKRHRSDAYTRRWLLLGGVFFAMSVDEMASLHELLIQPMRDLGAGGYLYFGWVVPGMLFVGACGLYFLGLLRSLPSPYRLLFVGAGLLFVGGAVGVEMLGGNYAEVHGTRNLPYTMYQTVEETCEISGVLLFIYALLGYARAHAPATVIRVEP